MAGLPPTPREDLVDRNNKISQSWARWFDNAQKNLASYVDDKTGLSVKSFGAKGDGINDDTGAIIAARNASSAISTALGISVGIYFPSGTYVTSATLTFDSGIHLFGDGPRQSVIKRKSTFTTGDTIRVEPADLTSQWTLGFNLSNIRLDSAATMTSGNHVTLKSAWNMAWHDVEIINGLNGIQFFGCYRSMFTNIKVENNSNDGAVVDNFGVKFSPLGVTPSNHGVTHPVAMWFANLDINTYFDAGRPEVVAPSGLGSFRNGMVIEACDSIWLTNAHINYSTHRQLYVKPPSGGEFVTGLYFSGVYFDGNTFSDSTPVATVEFDATDGQIGIVGILGGKVSPIRGVAPAMVIKGANANTFTITTNFGRSAGASDQIGLDIQGGTAITCANSSFYNFGGTTGTGVQIADGVTNTKVYGNSFRSCTNNIVNNATDPTVIATESIGGGVSGPVSSTDNAIVRFDGTSGQTVQNSATTIDDSGQLETSVTGGSGTHILNAEGFAQWQLNSYSSTNNPNWNSRRGRGTILSPSAVQTGDKLGQFGFKGYGTTGFKNNSAAIFYAKAEAAFTDTYTPTSFVFATSNVNADAAPIDRLQFHSDGVIEALSGAKFKGDGSLLSGIAAASGSSGCVQLSDGASGLTSDAAINYTNGTLTLAKSGSHTTMARLWITDDSGFHVADISYNGTGTFSAINATTVDATTYKLGGNALLGTGANQVPQLNASSQFPALPTYSATTAGQASFIGATNVIPLRVERLTAATTSNANALTISDKTTGNMADGFGGNIQFLVTDDTATDQALGNIGFVRAGADNTGDFAVRPTTAGTANERFRVFAAGGGRIGTNATDNTTFEADGTMTFNGAATVFNDLNISALMITTAGATVPTLTAINSSTVKAHGFTGTGVTVNEGWASLEILHDYKEGTDITPHVHWMPTTTGAGNIKWQMDYYWLNNGDVAGSPTTITLTAAAGGTAWKEQRHSFTAVTGTGKTIGSRFMFRIYRDPADAADTYGDTAILTDIGIHYEIDTVGSRQITTK